VIWPPLSPTEQRNHSGTRAQSRVDLHRPPKLAVHDFWNVASCGEVYTDGATVAEQLEAHARARYELEPYLRPFARFHEAAGLDVLEVGVGMGADHLEIASARPKRLCGVDLTERAIDFTSKRLALNGLRSELHVADAEALPFPNESFDLVYSYGALHHSPDTPKAVEEAWRVLRVGGKARIMIYHKWSIVGLMLWTRYGLMKGRLASLKEIYAEHLESPGTKAYTVDDAKAMFSRFAQVQARSSLSFGDLLEGEVGQRHQGVALRLAKAVWPRRLIRALFPRWGLLLFIEAVK
jgi:ubiquinone/menaquinone biosynthesis C-methylase UbiE